MLGEYDTSGGGLINVVPPTEMAKVKIVPLQNVDDSEEFFFFTVDFYACQKRE